MYCADESVGAQDERWSSQSNGNHWHNTAALDPHTCYMLHTYM